MEFHGSEISDIQGEIAQRYMVTRKSVYKHCHFFEAKSLNNKVYPMKAIALNLKLNMHFLFVAVLNTTCENKTRKTIKWIPRAFLRNNKTPKGIFSAVNIVVSRDSALNKKKKIKAYNYFNSTTSSSCILLSCVVVLKNFIYFASFILETVLKQQSKRLIFN